jgi:hypothetical protein
VKLGDRVNTGSSGSDFQVGAPLTVVEPDHALVAGTWAFILEPAAGGSTRLLVRERYPGWMRRAALKRSGMRRALGGAVDYLFAEPPHFLMERKMMLGLKERAETAARAEAAGPEPKEGITS